MEVDQQTVPSAAAISMHVEPIALVPKEVVARAVGDLDGLDVVETEIRRDVGGFARRVIVGIEVQGRGEGAARIIQVERIVSADSRVDIGRLAKARGVEGVVA